MAACAHFSIPGDALVASFDPTPSEPDIALANRSWRRTVLPVVRRDGDGRVVPEPEWTGDVSQAAIVFVPALAVDAAGTRLGQGGGWYDRALEALPAGVPVVAVVFDEELIGESLPREPWDVPVDAVVTPSRFVVIHKSASGG